MVGSNMRQKLKAALNTLLVKTCSHRLVHHQTLADSDDQVWLALKEKGFAPRELVDIGASTGLWTKELLHIYPKARYLMVDPLHENEAALGAVSSEHVAVQYWLGALGRQEGELALRVHGPQTSIYSSEWGGESRRVPVKTLDALLSERGFHDVDAMKLDVQGAELDVLSGATSVLRRCKVVQVEVSFRRIYKNAPLAHDVICFLATRGFRIFDFAALYKRRDRALLQADLFFVSDDALFQPESWQV
ncbi:MAG: FkbM family methyltransferase [Kiritimatiellae bacterium]|nr:FkbM family methyltransferase [Kiritimatiellia bacterium]